MKQYPAIFSLPPRRYGLSPASALASRIFPAAILLCLLHRPVLAGEPVWLGRFDGALSEPPAPWRLVRFDEKIPATQYRVRKWDGIAAIEAVAVRSMALLARPVAVDLAATPVLCWRWRIDAPLASADTAQKSGDDYAARVYITFKLADSGMSFSTRMKLKIGRAIYGPDAPDAALNYVWDNRYPVGTQRWNAYTDRARMIVVESGSRRAGQWVIEQRDIQADFTANFNVKEARLTSLAIASDTDNTGETAHAGFADLHLVPRGQPCSFL